MHRKLHVTLFLQMVLISFLYCRSVQASIQLEYTIEIRTDGSAIWTVKQKGTEISNPLTAYDTFVKNVTLLVSVAEKETQRNMSVEYMPMTFRALDSYKIVTYEFHWMGFADVKAGRIIIGDVFNIANFFSYLYGNGEVRIVYPEGYIVESISPSPHEWETSIQRLEWFSTEAFKIGEPKIILVRQSIFSVFIDVISKNVILIFGLLALISSGSISLYYFKFKRNKMRKGTGQQASKFSGISEIADDEEKVINLLKTAGGNLYQSTITDRCGFSRSKTSKLLKEMEKKGRIKRKEKGREKIVTLLEDNGEE